MCALCLSPAGTAIHANIRTHPEYNAYAYWTLSSWVCAYSGRAGPYQRYANELSNKRQVSADTHYTAELTCCHVLRKPMGGTRSSFARFQCSQSRSPPGSNPRARPGMKMRKY